MGWRQLCEAGGDVGTEGEVEVAAGGPLEVAGCNRCHDAAEPLDPQTPSLEGIGARMGRDQLFIALANHPQDPELDGATFAELQALVDQMSDL